ncbi:MAG: hypothetical protein LBH69_05850 [Methanomassiliicoccaceae archaeon]|nr:hypothetical protein [Methanomassiliicoccaceae archaeon]
MSEVKLTIDAGVCRFKTRIHAIGSEDYMSVNLVIESECPNVKRVAETLKVVDAIEIVSPPLTGNGVYRAFDAVAEIHTACPIPCGVLKACEAASGNALKKNVTFTFE